MTNKDCGGDGDSEPGMPSLLESVMWDIAKDKGCEGCELHKDGCVRRWGMDTSKHPFHEYCDKFAWIVKRAEYYAEKTGQTAEDVLKGWEANRRYWYMNYYQECNQPDLGDNCRVYEDAQDCADAIRGQRFECPHCKKMVDDPQECKECGWKSYGLFSSRYKVYLKKEGAVIPIFRPGNWNAVGRKNKAIRGVKE